MLERLPSGLQQQPLVGIHRERLTRADAEEVRIEVADALDEAALAYVTGARVVGIGVIQSLQIPAAIGWESPHCVATLGEQLPQLPHVAHAAGVATGHPHQRDRLLAARPSRGDLATHCPCA